MLMSNNAVATLTYGYDFICETLYLSDSADGEGEQQLGPARRNPAPNLPFLAWHDKLWRAEEGATIEYEKGATIEYGADETMLLKATKVDDQWWEVLELHLSDDMRKRAKDIRIR